MNLEESIKKETIALLDLMKIKAECVVSFDDDMYTVHLTVDEDDDPARLIGHHADVLNSLQRILSIIIFQQKQERVSLLVDVNDYRERQKERLEGIAANVAQRVMDGEEEQTLHSFSPYERKVVHIYISQNYPDLQTTSEGEGDSRHLVIQKK
ncbi:MAG: protein jag [Candidatus Roizmanbacteria bacterium]